MPAGNINYARSHTSHCCPCPVAGYRQTVHRHRGKVQSANYQRSRQVTANSSRLDRQFHAAVALLHPMENGRPVSPEALMDYFKRDVLALLEKPESWQAAMIYEWLMAHELDLTG